MPQSNAPEVLQSWDLENGPKIVHTERRNLGEVNLIVDPKFIPLEADLKELFQHATSAKFIPLSFRE